MSTLIATKVKDAEIWLPRFINQVENLQGDISEIIVMYSKSPDRSYSYLEHWRDTSKHVIKLYADPYMPPEERHGAMLARVKRDIQELLRKSTAEYYLNLDCDLVKIDPYTIPKLIEADKDLIAGMVWTEGRAIQHFFDTYIYRMNGCRFHPLYPPGLGATEPFQVDSVSTYYLAKRQVELDGKYINPYPHIPFCDDLRKKGYSIWVHPQVEAYHIDLERLGISHMPLPIGATFSNFIDNQNLQYYPEQVGAQIHNHKRVLYEIEMLKLTENYMSAYRERDAWLRTRPLITAMYKVYHDVDWLKYSLESIYPYVDHIDIATGPVIRRGAELNDDPEQIKQLPDPEGKIRVFDRVWSSKEEAQSKLLEVCNSKWILYIDSDEVVSGMDKVREFCMSHPAGDMIYVRPKIFHNFYGDFMHVCYSLNPASPWYRYGMPHPFLLHRDIEGLNFSGFHTIASDGYGFPLHSDHPYDREKKMVLDGVEVYHYGNAREMDALMSKRDYYASRGDTKVYEDAFTSGVLDPDMVLEEYDGEQPSVMLGHPLYGVKRIEITEEKPVYKFRWLQ